MSCEQYRHDLQMWLHRHSWNIRDNTATVYCLRGDAYVEMTLGWQAAQRLADPEYFAAWEKLVTAELDQYVDEAHCKESGGHEFVNDQCVKCHAWNLENAG